jgi:hypothetical protein
MLPNMTVTPDQIVHIFSAVLQAKIAADEEKFGGAFSPGKTSTTGKLVVDSMQITQEAVASLKQVDF